MCPSAMRLDIESLSRMEQFRISETAKLAIEKKNVYKCCVCVCYVLRAYTVGWNIAEKNQRNIFGDKAEKRGGEGE